MKVAHDTVGLTSYDDAQLGMRLEFLHAIDHLDLGFFEFAGPFDVASFVKAGFEFDDGRHILATLSGTSQRGNDWTIATGAIESCLMARTSGRPKLLRSIEQQARSSRRDARA